MTGNTNVSLWWPWEQSATGEWSPAQEFAADSKKLALRTEYTWKGRASRPVFDAWKTARPDPAAWQSASDIELRSSFGLPLELTNIDGNPSSRVYPLNETQQIVQIDNCRVSRGEGNWYGFESYERNPGWVDGGGGVPALTEEDAHTGTRCASVAPGTALASTCKPGRPLKYIFSCWCRSTKTAGGTAVWNFSNAASGTPLAPPVSIPSDGEEWRYVVQVIDLTEAPAGTTLHTALQNQTSAAILVDELRFCPLAGGLTASIFDAARLLPTATIDENGRPTYRAYDQAGRVAGSCQPAAAATISASWLTPGRGPAPGKNNELSIVARAAGAYTWYTRANWRKAWLAEKESDWAVADGQLAFAGTARSSLRLAGWDGAAHMSVQFELTPGAPLTQPIEIALGAELSLALQPGGNGVWRVSGALAPAPVAHPRGGSFLCCLVVSGGNVFLLVDGLLIFSFSASVIGPLELRIAQRGTTLRHCLLALDPLVTVRYLTGTGADTQMHVLDHGTAAISAKIYDALGRTAITTKPALLAADAGHPLLAYRSEFAIPDWSGGPMKGTLAHYYSPGGGGPTEDGGYPFHRTLYDSCPLSRIREVGSPGQSRPSPAAMSTLFGERGASILRVCFPPLLRCRRANSEWQRQRIQTG